MAGDLLVRGGLVVDGMKRAPREADVRVRGGRIVEVEAGLAPEGEQEIDAAGCFVAPGFIEQHTHYDGSLWWDPSCDPMPAFGTTTCVIGNCGHSLAPIRARDRSQLIDLYCFIEDLPNEAFAEAIPAEKLGDVEEFINTHHARVLRGLRGNHLAESALARYLESVHEEE